MSNPQYPPNQPPYQPTAPGTGGYQQQPYQQQGFPPPAQNQGYQQPNYQQPNYQQPGYPPQAYSPQPVYPNQAGYGGYGAPVSATNPASFGQRVGATIIDGLVLLIPNIVFIIIGAILVGSSCTNPTFDPTTNTTTCTSVSGGSAALGIALLILGPFIVYLAYYLVLVGKGQTVGDRVAGIKIVDANGNPPGAGKAFIRLLVQAFISGIFFIGYLWMLWDPAKQTLHDKAAGTFAVSARS